MQRIETVLTEAGIPSAAIWLMLEVIRKLSTERRKQLCAAIEEM